MSKPAASRKSALLGSFLVRYEGRLLRFAMRLLGGDYHGAQDVVQETFTQVARYPDRLLAAESCHNWLLKVARNIGISRLRRTARARRHHEALREKTAAWKARLSAIQDKAELATALDEILPEAFAAVKEACRRLVRISERHVRQRRFGQGRFHAPHGPGA